jgi:hypothetical protein
MPLTFRGAATKPKHFQALMSFDKKCVTLGRFGEPHANRLLGSGQAYSRSAPTYERTNEINDLQCMLEK